MANRTPAPQFNHGPAEKPPARPRLDNHPALDAWHRECDRRLKAYLHLERAGWQRLDHVARAELEPNAAKFLLANNLAARTRYARLLDEHLAAHLRRRRAGVPLFWVTLVAEQFAMPLGAATRFDPRRLIAWTRAVLGPSSFVGVVEAAFYSNVRLIRDRFQRVVSWHVHLLVWDLTDAEMTDARDRLNRRYETHVPGVTAAHFSPITLAQIQAKACYAMKAPFTDYRVYPRRREHVDSETGEVTREATGRFTQRKREMRPGDMVRVCRVFAGRTIDRLTFAAGDGAALLKRLNGEALAPYRRWDRGQPWHRR